MIVQLIVKGTVKGFFFVFRRRVIARYSKIRPSSPSLVLVLIVHVSSFTGPLN